MGDTSWRGVPLDPRSIAMMDEVARLCPEAQITPTQGSPSGAAASAGTHSGQGAIDIACSGIPRSITDQIVLNMRKVGWAAWFRTPDQGNWPYHIHGVACAEPDLSPAAKDQEQSYYAGRNGLANNGPDDGPRQYVGVTWETYQQQHKPPPSRRPDMITIRSDKSGTIYLLGSVALAGIANTNDLKELMAAMQNPNHTAVVTQATFDAIKKAT